MAIDPKHYVIELEHPNGFTVSRLLLTSPCIIRDDFQCPFIEFMILIIIPMNTRQITKLFFSQWLLFLITWHRSHLLVFFLPLGDFYTFELCYKNHVKINQRRPNDWNDKSFQCNMIQFYFVTVVTTIFSTFCFFKVLAYM